MRLNNSFWNSLYRGPAYVPVLSVLIIVALQTIFSLDARELWYSDEIRHGNAFQNLIHEHKWLVLYLNGEVYPDKPPVYFWFISMIYLVLGEISPRLFFIGAAVSGALFLVSILVLSRILGRDNETSLLACLIILSTFYFVTLLHYARMDLLFAAFITLSHACLFRGQQKEQAPGWISAGFVLAALATLTKGPLGFIFPLLALFVFLLCRGRLKRLFSRDMALGLALLAGICLAWFAGAYVVEGREFINAVFGEQILGRAVDSWHHQHPWWHYLAVLPAVMLPWSLVVFVLPWKDRIFTLDPYYNAGSFFRKGDEASVYLWVSLGSGFILLSLISTKVAIYLLPLFPFMAIILAGYLSALAREKCAGLFKGIAVLIFILGLVFVFFRFFNPWGIDIAGALITGFLGMTLGTILWFLAPEQARGGTLILALMLAAWVQPMAKIMAPSLDRVMSPREQAEIMKDYIQEGYHAVSFRIYSGTYTYYAGHNITETRDMDYLEDLLDTHPRVVLAIRQRHWDSWEDRPENLEIVHSQFLVEHNPANRYLLAVIRNNSPENREQKTEDKGQRTED